MKIFWETPTGIKIPADVDPTEKISKLKKKVLLKDPTTFQLKFFFQGKELYHRTTLEENGVHENSSIFLELIEKNRRSGWWQRGRVPRGGGGAGIFPVIPESWLRLILIVTVVMVAAGSYYHALMRTPDRPVVIDPVVIDPIVIDVHDDVVPGPPPLSDDEESVIYFTVATQWPNAHVKAKGKSHTLLVPNRATLHGLWPEVEIPSTTPFDIKMGRDRVLIKRASENWPNLDSRGSTISPIEHNLGFWKHEWDEHGVKSGLIQGVYMKLALDIFDEIDPDLNECLQAIMKSDAASTSSSSKRRPSKAIDFDPHDLEEALTEVIARPRIICRPPGEHNIFHGVRFRVQVRIKGSSGSPTFKFVRMYGTSQCQESVTLL